MSSRNHSEDLTDIGLRHTFKNWVARKEAPAQGRERLLVAAVWQNTQPKPCNSINQRLEKIFRSAGVLSERSVYPCYGYALDSVYIVRASKTIA